MMQLSDCSTTDELEEQLTKLDPDNWQDTDQMDDTDRADIVQRMIERLLSE